MSKFHVGPNGPGPCGSDPNNPKGRGCPYGSSTEHYATIEEAQEVFEQQMEEEYGTTSTVSDENLIKALEKSVESGEAILIEDEDHLKKVFEDRYGPIDDTVLFDSPPAWYDNYSEDDWLEKESREEYYKSAIVDEIGVADNETWEYDTNKMDRELYLDETVVPSPEEVAAIAEDYRKEDLMEMISDHNLHVGEVDGEPSIDLYSSSSVNYGYYSAYSDQEVIEEANIAALEEYLEENNIPYEKVYDNQIGINPEHISDEQAETVKEALDVIRDDVVLSPDTHREIQVTYFDGAARQELEEKGWDYGSLLLSNIVAIDSN